MGTFGGSLQLLYGIHGGMAHGLWACCRGDIRSRDCAYRLNRLLGTSGSYYWRATGIDTTFRHSGSVD